MRFVVPSAAFSGLRPGWIPNVCQWCCEVGEGDVQCRIGPRKLNEGKGASRSMHITMYVPVAWSKLSSGANRASDRTSHQLPDSREEEG
jgi:hypothetical protein